MRISDVLAAKGRRVVTIRPEKRLDQIPTLFDDQSIASVVEADVHGRPLGIVTDRLFIRAMARHGMRAMELTVADAMETPAPSCSPADSVSEALRLMTEQRVRHLIVIEHGHMAGIVSIGDLVKNRLHDAELESKVLRDMALRQMASQ